MKLELQLPKDRFLAGESIDVDLRLTNTGPSSVEAPLLKDEANDFPVYTLTGPGFPQGETFSYRSVKWKEPGSVPPATSPMVRSVRPGSSLAGGFRLQEWKPLDQPGRYTLQARIEWKGWTASSDPVSFTLEPAASMGAGLGVDAGVARRGPLRLVWLTQAAEGRALGQTLVYEKRPDLGEVKHSGAQTLRQVGPRATEPFIPWANFDPAEGLWGWHGWREEGTLLALPIGAETPQSFDLGSPAARLVRPALMAAPSGDLDQFVLSEDGRELRWVRFSFPSGEGTASAPTVRWKHVLPAPALAARAALGTVAQGGSRRVALVSEEGGALVLHLVDVGDGSGPARVRSARVPQGHALRASEPGIGIDDQGGTRVAVVFSTDAAGTRLALAEAVFPSDAGGVPTAGETPLASLDKGERVAEAAVVYGVPGPQAPHGLVLLEGGDALSVASPERRFRLPSPPALPLTPLRLNTTTYVVLVDPQKGAFLEGLH
ncbi:hypothetical protein HPC49_13155 [Pyxidicoccus fallax]|uniref:Uncharacterized protein n=1 Tax=Pyxidicoccus fallax TaxID=394095 RepID=A0A848LFQ6_9BACT|nr:hypothetical protein [Pyxidicoccus fallax]NMO17212.1 hypothetical protein [Pyxidicoccus fallax]NPC79182.1 hypothetical protein [Pyxidicoccus fallax]